MFEAKNDDNKVYQLKVKLVNLKGPCMEVDINGLKKSKLYSEELGIDLHKCDDKGLFKWFLASVLFGARISETTAKNTYRSFEKYELLTPEKILEAGWYFLVNPIMREGGYVRYDEKTSTQILRNCSMILSKYDGSLNHLHEEASNSRDLEKRLKDFYGVGPITANIFLRELRPYWIKSNPEPLPIVWKIASKSGFGLTKFDWKSEAFVRIEAGLIRLRKKFQKII
jgi:hypothetical protein